MKISVQLPSLREKVPVIIEQLSPTAALTILSGEYRHDPGSPHTPFILAMRSLDGKLYAASVNQLICEGHKTVMECDRTIKWKSATELHLEKIGLCFLITRLHYMRENNLWSDRGEILYNFVPEVLNSYRRSIGISEVVPLMNLTGLALDGVTAREGERFLAASPFTLEILNP